MSRKTRWAQIDRYLEREQLMDPNSIRSFYTEAIKYLLPRSAWDDPFPPLRRAPLAHPALAGYIQGFEGQNTARMLDKSSPRQSLLRAAAGMRSRRAFTSNRELRRALGKLRDAMRQRLGWYVEGPRPWQGQTLVHVTICRHYIREGSRQPAPPP